MPWECPSCGLINNDDLCERCFCGYELQIEEPQINPHVTKHIFFSKSKILRFIILCLALFVIISYGIITEKTFDLITIVSALFTIILTYFIFKLITIYRTEKPALTLSENTIWFNKEYFNYNEIKWNDIISISKKIDLIFTQSIYRYIEIVKKENEKQLFKSIATSALKNNININTYLLEISVDKLLLSMNVYHNASKSKIE